VGQGSGSIFYANLRTDIRPNFSAKGKTANSAKSVLSIFERNLQLVWTTPLWELTV